MNSAETPGRVLDFAHISPATRLLDKRRQMFEVQEALVSQKEEFARREDALRRREDALRRKDVELQESLIKFNKFLQENENKKNRALKKIVEERKMRENKESEIKELEQSIANMIQEEEDLDVEVKKHEKYKEYLDSVSGSLTKFTSEIADILNRYKTLKEVNTQLIEKQQKAEEKKELEQRLFLSYSKEKRDEVLNLTNQISRRKEELEAVQIRTIDVQDDVDLKTNQDSKVSMELGQILSSISNMLERCEESFRLRHNKPPRILEKIDGMSLEVQTDAALSHCEEIKLFVIDFKTLKEDHTQMHQRSYSAY
jgi:myosin heavy subunit